MGDGVLLAPIVTGGGATSRELYLPTGRWYPWNGGAAIDGARKITADAPLGEIPVYARAGAVVPTFPDGVETLVREPSSAKGAASVGDNRIVLAFAGANGSFVERDGIRIDLTSGAVPPSGDVAASFEGGALAACTAAPVAPCAEILPDRVRARVTGPGSLIVTRGAPLAEVRVTGAKADAAMVIDVRY